MTKKQLPPYIITDAPTFIHTDGQVYFAKTRKYKYLREITGCPVIKINKTRHKHIGNLRDKYGRKYPIRKAVPTPRSCRYYRVINHNWTKLGAPQIAIIGNVGTGKTTLANLNVAFIKAKGKRIIYFVDRRMECRSLAWHGYYSKDVFHPFKLRVYVPEGYEFAGGTHLWNIRSNVTLHYFKDLSEVVKACDEPDVIVCLYDEAFDPKSRINLLEAVGHEIALTDSIDNHYVIVHNELETIIEESPEKATNKAVRALARAFVAFRKDRIGLICCFHMPEEVFFKITRKFNVVMYKRPVLKRRMSLAEFDAKNFSLAQVNITRGGRWTKHTIGIFPEVKDCFRSLPNDNYLSFDSINVSVENNEKNIDTDLDEILAEEIFSYMLEENISATEMAKLLDVSQPYVSKIIKNRKKEHMREKLAEIKQNNKK